MGHKNAIVYRVYDNETGNKVAEGSAFECAELLGVPRTSFYAFVFRMNENRKAKYRIETDKSNDYHARTSRNIYTVVSKSTNKIVVKGNANECSSALSLTIRSFYDLVSRAKKNQDRRYSISIGE